jgi:hypothetical protein
MPAATWRVGDDPLAADVADNKSPPGSAKDKPLLRDFAVLVVLGVPRLPDLDDGLWRHSRVHQLHFTRFDFLIAEPGFDAYS